MQMLESCLEKKKIRKTIMKHFWLNCNCFFSNCKFYLQENVIGCFLFFTVGPGVYQAIVNTDHRSSSFFSLRLLLFTHFGVTQEADFFMGPHILKEGEGRPK